MYQILAGVVLTICTLACVDKGPWVYMPMAFIAGNLLGNGLRSLDVVK